MGASQDKDASTRRIEIQNTSTYVRTLQNGSWHDVDWHNRQSIIVVVVDNGYIPHAQSRAELVSAIPLQIEGPGMVNPLWKMPVKAMRVFKKLVVCRKSPELWFVFLDIPFCPKTTVSVYLQERSWILSLY